MSCDTDILTVKKLGPFLRYCKSDYIKFERRHIILNFKSTITVTSQYQNMMLTLPEAQQTSTNLVTFNFEVFESLFIGSIHMQTLIYFSDIISSFDLTRFFECLHKMIFIDR